MQSDPFQDLDESGLPPRQVNEGFVRSDSHLSGKLVYLAVLVEQLHVEIPHHRVEILFLFGAEEVDPSYKFWQRYCFLCRFVL